MERVEYGTHACTHTRNMEIPECDNTLQHTGKVDKVNEWMNECRKRTTTTATAAGCWAETYFINRECIQMNWGYVYVLYTHNSLAHSPLSPIMSSLNKWSYAPDMLNSLIFIICLIYVRWMFYLLSISYTLDAEHGIQSAHMEYRVAWLADSVRCDSLAGKYVFTLINLTRLLLWHVNMYAYTMQNSIYFDGRYTFMAGETLSRILLNAMRCDVWLSLSLSILLLIVCYYLLVNQLGVTTHKCCRCFDTLAQIHRHTALKSTDWLADRECNAWILSSIGLLSIFSQVFVFCFLSAATKNNFQNFCTLFDFLGAHINFRRISAYCCGVDLVFCCCIVHFLFTSLFLFIKTKLSMFLFDLSAFH